MFNSCIFDLVTPLCSILYRRKALTAGVHIIPKIADFLDPKIIFFPQLYEYHYHLKKICPHFFQICQFQMELKKELYGPLLYSSIRITLNRLLSRWQQRNELSVKYNQENEICLH